MEQERIKNRLYGFYGSKLPMEYQEGYKSFLNQLINSVKEEVKEDCAKIAEIHRYSCSEMTYRHLIAKAIRECH